MMTKIYDIEELKSAIDWQNKSVAIIGKGKYNSKYVFNKDTTEVFGINESILFYPHTKWTVIVEAHWKKNYPIVNGNVENIVYIPKGKMKPLKLISGCTPSLFISYILKHIQNWGKILYLQGFSMDGRSPANDPFPYDWKRQESAFRQCFDVAREKRITMGFVTPCTRAQDLPRICPTALDIMISQSQI